MPIDRVNLAGIAFNAVTEAQAVEYVQGELERGEGGWIVTPNVDILRQASAGGVVLRYLADASLVVADGAPLVWASRLAGTPLPGRVAGSDLVWSLARMAAAEDRSLFLIGGQPAVPRPAGPGGRVAGLDGSGGQGAAPVAEAPARPAGVPGPAGDGPDGAGHLIEARPRIGVRQRDGGRQVAPRPVVAPQTGAQRAAVALGAALPGLRVVGAVSPPYRFDLDPVLTGALRGDMVEAKPDLVYVGLGFPRQERLISMLRPYLPGTWFLGCGAAINFLAGDNHRAPRWMQRCGLEWAHRLAGEPRRLGRRYLRQDAPYALRLLARAAASRYSSDSSPE